MKEPYFSDGDGDSPIAFSAAPISLLRQAASGQLPSFNDGEMGDDDFENRYAAILLRERGF